MNGVGKLGRLGVAITVVIASVVLGATPARADGYVHYENVGNPGWCMGTVGGAVRLSRCDNSGNQRWWWSVQPTGPLAGMIRLRATSYPGVSCLADVFSYAVLETCNADAANQHWSVWGQNGWVVYQRANSLSCLIPLNTSVVQVDYEIALVPCPVRTNVPNIFAWRYS
jgi:hypothetical protein